MPTKGPTQERNLDGYGAPMIEWAEVRAVLDEQPTQAPGTGGPGRHTTCLTPFNPDGSAHVMAVGAVRVDGYWYFSSGPGTRKSRNIERDPRCVASIATEPFDLVVEGVAKRVLDGPELKSVAEVYNSGGWPAQVAGDSLAAEFSAPSAGPAPWYVYRIVPSTVFALATAEPYGATRFDLSASE